MRKQIMAAIAISFVPWSGAFAHPAIGPEIVNRIPARLPDSIGKIKNPTQIELGRRLFEKATFGGNGRTCATCHKASQNFALSPANVKARPLTDPLFVFKRIPALAGLENEAALRSKALILENLDGFGQPGVLRSVPHIFGLGQTINPEPGLGLTHALGWGGDGSPGAGALRDFAVGAVVQHFTKSLERVVDRDFKIPTAAQLDQLEAFQLSIGRQTTPNLGSMIFIDANVIAGQTLFAGMPSRNGGTRRCSGCHTGGGALNDVGQNEQRANGNEASPGAPACFFPTAPGDGGFGLTPVRVVDRADFCVPEPEDDGDPTPPSPPLTSGPVTFQGNQFFNTASAIEAADTLPAFHDNSAKTLEEVIEFYDSDIFNDSITGAGNGFIIPTANRNQIALFLRTLNVLENIRSVLAVLPANNATKKATAKRDMADAIKVIKQGPLKAHQTTALPALVSAQKVILSNPTKAIAELTRARGLIAN